MTERVETPSSNGAGADIDAVETTEWLEAVDAVVEHDGPDRARQILARAVQRAQLAGSGPIASITTPYVNTIPPEREAKLPGDPLLERRLRSIVRWNAMAMVVRANKLSSELGGHIASFQSLATLYEVGYNHFWHAPSDEHGGDLVYFQGHSSPGNYARAYLEGRLTEEQLDNFRQEVDGAGLSSYPHPWLMPEFWQFPTVSLGIGAITSIYQARFMKYLEARGVVDTDGRKVWAFLGDGEMDEPETMGATALAGPRAPRQPDLGRELQPAAPRRPGSRQRQDHPGARGRLPRRRLERDQGRLGNALGSVAGAGHRRPPGQGHGGVRRRRVPDVQVARRRVRARALLRPRSGAARARLAHVRRGDLAVESRRARPAEGVCRLPRGGRSTPASRP